MKVVELTATEALHTAGGRPASYAPGGRSSEAGDRGGRASGSEGASRVR